jgi:hypothetical protein
METVKNRAIDPAIYGFLFLRSHSLGPRRMSHRRRKGGSAARLRMFGLFWQICAMLRERCFVGPMSAAGQGLVGGIDGRMGDTSSCRCPVREISAGAQSHASSHHFMVPSLHRRITTAPNSKAPATWNVTAVRSMGLSES